MEIITEFKQQVIETNFEDVKADLQKVLEDYKHIVVTEETLTGSKNAQKELASLRVSIDNKRKEIKKLYNKPLEEFESKCKELIALVTEAETPIKEGIEVFDNARREEKRKVAEELIKIVSANAELEERFASKLTVDAKYLNLTATKSEVKADLEIRAVGLMAEQRAYHERLDIINSAIVSANKRIEAKISIDTFKWDIDSGVPTGTILTKINNMADSIYEAENKPKEEPKPVETVPEVKETPKAETPMDVAIFKVDLSMTGTREQMISVSDFLKANNITYTIVSQHRV